MSRADEKPKRGVSNYGRRVHAYYGGKLPTDAMCGVHVVEPWPMRYASGEDRWEYWGIDPDSCSACLRALRKETSHD